MSPHPRPHPRSASGMTLAEAAALIDSLHSHVILLDGEGRILAANRAWRDHAAALRPDLEGVGPSANLDAICRLTPNGGDGADGNSADRDTAERFGAGLKSVLSGEELCFEIESEAVVDGEPHLFRRRATRVEDTQGPFIVVSHSDVTMLESPVA